jgi:hypothetical protein
MVRIVNGSFSSTAPKLRARRAPRRGRPRSTTLRPPQLASNILIASGKASQTARRSSWAAADRLNYPGLTLEMDLHGPTSVRGATSAPFPGYMLIGRGRTTRGR